MWAPLRSTVSQAPRPLERLGIDEKVKITAAQRTTGSQKVSARDLAIPRPMLVSGPQTGERQGNPVQVRNGPAAVRGDAPASKATGLRAGKAATGGRPESEDLRPPAPEPLVEGGFVYRSLSLLVALAALVALLAVQPAGAAVPHRIISLSPTATESLF